MFLSFVIIDVEEIETAIKCLKPAKAAGWDGILPEFLHNIGQKAKLWLLKVYYLCTIVDTGSVPTSWKHAKVGEY